MKMRASGCVSKLALCLVVVLPGMMGSAAQKPQATVNQTGVDVDAGETSSLPTFRSDVNLVLVPVVVRDSKGNAVGNLRREDFQLFDNGKPQVVRHFSVQKAIDRTSVPSKVDSVDASETRGNRVAAVPRRFFAYDFDDVRLDMADLVRARAAAVRHLEFMGPEDRVALYTTSGRNTVEFTDDVTKIREGLMQLLASAKTNECPDIGIHWASLMDRGGYREDDPYVAAAVQERTKCPDWDPSEPTLIRVSNMARRILGVSGDEARRSVTHLDNVVKRMSALPGERTVMMVSPGFLVIDQQQELARVVERAVQAKLVINALDARGLYIDPSFQNASSGGAPTPNAVGSMVRNQQAIMQDDVLQELADGSGGTLFRNNNDLDEGFRRLNEPPAYSYLLGFSPRLASPERKTAVHQLKVRLVGQGAVTIQARRGYVVADASSPVEQERQQIENALFSLDEVRGVPIRLRTESSKAANGDTTLDVFVHFDPRDLPLRKIGDRNCDELKVYAAAFDRNGNYVSGDQKKFDLRLADGTLTKLTSGAALKLSLGLHSGNYVVRVVVRESERQLIAASNTDVKIP